MIENGITVDKLVSDTITVDDDNNGNVAVGSKEDENIKGNYNQTQTAAAANINNDPEMKNNIIESVNGSDDKEKEKDKQMNKQTDKDKDKEVKYKRKFVEKYDLLGKDLCSIKATDYQSGKKYLINSIEDLKLNYLIYSNPKCCAMYALANKHYHVLRWLEQSKGVIKHKVIFKHAPNGHHTRSAEWAKYFLGNRGVGHPDV